VVLLCAPHALAHPRIGPCSSSSACAVRPQACGPVWAWRRRCGPSRASRRCAAWTVRCCRPAGRWRSWRTRACRRHSGRAAAWARPTSQRWRRRWPLGGLSIAPQPAPLPWPPWLRAWRTRGSSGGWARSWRRCWAAVQAPAGRPQRRGTAGTRSGHRAGPRRLIPGPTAALLDRPPRSRAWLGLLSMGRWRLRVGGWRVALRLCGAPCLDSQGGALLQQRQPTWA
jgi:hypothetical protein